LESPTPKTDVGRAQKIASTADLIRRYIPNSAWFYCNELLERYDFNFILKKERQTKLGDFRRDKKNNYTITVNRNLNPYQFLVTFIHEFAHLEVAVKHPRSVKAHGQEWKNSFKNLMLPLLHPAIFPDDLLRPLARHMRNPKAAAASDPELWRALQKYNEQDSQLTLAEIAVGGQFVFKNRTFLKIKKRRTRVLCQDVNNGKQYLIPEVAEVSELSKTS